MVRGALLGHRPCVLYFLVSLLISQNVLAYEVIDYFGIEVRMHDVEECPKYESILEHNNGFLCYSSPSLENKFPREHGCLIRVIYPSGRGAVNRTGFWWDWNETRQAQQLTLLGNNEALIGSSIFYNETGVIEVETSEEKTAFVTSCRLSKSL